MNLLLGQIKPFYMRWSKNVRKNILWMKKIMLIFISILAGLCLFIIITNLILYTTLLDADFHERLLADEDIFSYISSITQKATNNLNITPEIVQSNIYSTIRGLINYIKKNENLLPDLHFNNDILNLKDLGYMNNPVGNIGNVDNIDNTSNIYNIIDIDKINLSTVLLFLNRSYITDSLTVLRLLFECLKTAFSIVTLFFFLLIIIMLITAKERKGTIKYWQLFICFSGLLCLISGFICFIYSKNKFLKFIYPLFYQFDISQDIKVDLTYMLTSYIKKCLGYIIFYLVLCSLFLISVSIIIPHAFNFLKSSETSRLLKSSPAKSKVFLFAIVLVTVLLMQNISNFKENYKNNNFLTLTSRIRKYGSASPVILAKDENIFLFQVYVIDRSNRQPIRDMRVVLTSKGSNNNADNIEYPSLIKESITDDNGVASFFTSTGAFSIKLLPSGINNKYYLPESFSVNVKASGNNTITIYLPIE